MKYQNDTIRNFKTALRRESKTFSSAITFFANVAATCEKETIHYLSTFGISVPTNVDLKKTIKESFKPFKMWLLAQDNAVNGNICTFPVYDFIGLSVETSGTFADGKEDYESNGMKVNGFTHYKAKKGNTTYYIPREAVIAYEELDKKVFTSKNYTSMNRPTKYTLIKSEFNLDWTASNWCKFVQDSCDEIEIITK